MINMSKKNRFAYRHLKLCGFSHTINNYFTINSNPKNHHIMQPLMHNFFLTKKSIFNENFLILGN